jgi:hypothetical protein
VTEDKFEHSFQQWESIGRDAAAEIKTTPIDVAYVEARGPLCHELLCLLGGSVEYAETPWKSFLTKVLEHFAAIAPLCRWVPPPNSQLERVGYHPMGEAVVYRFTPDHGDRVIFFVNYKPEPPAGGRYVRPLFNLPQLDLNKFIRPPFDHSNQDRKLPSRLRPGSVQLFTPIPQTDDAVRYGLTLSSRTNLGIWEELCRD